VSVFKVLEVSTVHVDPDFYAGMAKACDDKESKWPTLVIIKDEFSITLCVPIGGEWLSPDEKTFLGPLIEKARALDCVRIIIDRDGEVYPDLPSFDAEWEAKE
jgi:hypothetical protein